MKRIQKRQSIFQINVEVCERQKTMEKVLSNEIDENLRVLRLFYPFNDALQAVFVKDVFIKPNPKAMPLVIHYLLMIYSPTTFRKKFRWPITTKMDETAFRQTTLTFFNELHAKHNWEIGPIKMQLILFPGGVEFMKLIQHFSNLVMSVALKRETSSTMISSLNLTAAKRKLNDLQKFYENTQIYCRKLMVTSELYRTKVTELRRMLRDISSGTTFGMLLQEIDGSVDSVAEEWDLMQHQDIEFEIQPMMADVSGFLAKQKTCANKIELIFDATRKIQYDPMRIQNFVDETKQLYVGENANGFNEIVVDQKINLNNLLNCFASILPHILNELFQMKPLNVNQINTKANQLMKISRKLDGFVMRLRSMGSENDNQVNSVVAVDSMRSIGQFSNLTVRIKSMLMNTPPIIDTKLKQLKRPRISSVEPSPLSNECYDIGRKNLSSVSEDVSNANDSLPASKRFRSSNFTSNTDTFAPLSIKPNQNKQLKTNAIEMLKNIQMKKNAEPLKNSRRSMMQKSFMQFTPSLDCPIIRVKAPGTLELTPGAPFTTDESNTFFMEKISIVGSTKNSSIAAGDVLKCTRIRKRLSLDGA